MKLTYTIQVCNESRELFSLVNFLQKVKDNEDEINVVVDTNNVTEKVEDVLAFFSDGIRVFRRPFDDFCKNPTYHKSVATGDYIFHIDADEMPQEDLIRKLKEIIETSGAEVLYVPRMNIHPGATKAFLEEMKFNVNEAGWVNWPDYQGRVYKNADYISWSDELHSKLTGTTKVAAIQADPKLGMWHIKSLEKQASRWKKIEDGTYTIFPPEKNSLYDKLM
jgi:hypothetical protein